MVETEVLPGMDSIHKVWALPIPDCCAAIAEAMGDAVLLIGETGVLLHANPAVERIFGYKSAELVGRPLGKLLAEPHPSPDEIRGHGLLETTGLHKSGGKVPVSISLGKFTHCGQRILTAIVRDTTEIQQMKRSLAASEHCYRALVDSLREVAFQTDEAGRWTFLNPIWTSITGFAIDDTLGRKFLEFIHPDDRPHAEELFAALNSGKQGFGRCEIRHSTKDGNFRWVQVAAWLQPPDANGRMTAGISGTMIDVTERREGEEDLRHAKEAAEQVSQAKDEFLSRVSHELRTPMHVILGFTQLLALEDLSDGQKSNVDRILKAGKHLRSLLDDILDLSRIESGRLAIEFERLDPVEVLRSAIDLMQPLLAERNVHCKTLGLQGPKIEILADRQRLMQVFLNLVSNAAKYNRENGDVVLTRECTSDGRLRISITDTGAGIPQEALLKLFVPFQRLGAERTKVPGTGLGLCVSKKMTELMNGVIGVESTPGIGSTFWLEFPRFEPSEAECSSGSDPLAEHTRSATVLYIEDNPLNLLLIQRIFEKSAKLRFITSMLGSMGIEMARLHTPALILLDLHLPDMAGADVLSQLRKHPRTAAIPVVVVTADELPSTEQQMIEAGAFAFIKKPIDVKALMKIAMPILRKDPVQIYD